MGSGAGRLWGWCLLEQVSISATKYYKSTSDLREVYVAPRSYCFGQRFEQQLYGDTILSVLKINCEKGADVVELGPLVLAESSVLLTAVLNAKCSVQKDVLIPSCSGGAAVAVHRKPLYLLFAFRLCVLQLRIQQRTC